MCQYSYQNCADLLDTPQKGSQGLPRVLGDTLRTTAVDKASTRQGSKGLDFMWGVAH